MTEKKKKIKGYWNVDCIHPEQGKYFSVCETKEQALTQKRAKWKQGWRKFKIYFTRLDK